jgi:CRISPR-associated protein Csm1
MAETKKNEHTVFLSNDSLSPEYKKLANNFLEDLKTLPVHEQQNPDALRSVTRTLLALMEKYLSQIPAATNVIHPDISLFDHLRITAAIAEGLYHYHADNLAAADFKDQQTPEWRLVCGDFSGIQNFM